jgi:hypothetical protein
MISYCSNACFPIHTVQTVAADLRQGEHIPKMQNDIGHKSKLRVLRQRGGKEGGGAGCHVVPCRAVTSRAVPGHAAPGVAFCTTAVNLRPIEFGSGIAKNTRWARTTFLQDCNPVLYHPRHTYLMKISILNTTFPIQYSVLCYTILYYTIL